MYLTILLFKTAGVYSLEISISNTNTPGSCMSCWTQVNKNRKKILMANRKECC